mgnify:CR=1 FL=1
MIALLLFLVPLIGGLLTFLPNKSGMARSLALGSALLSLAGVIAGLTLFKQPLYWEFDAEWLQTLGSRFSLKGDAMGMLMSLLTSIGVLLAVLGSWNNDVQGSNRFYGLLLWMQAGMMVVFLASDALLFYFGWELALIPAYFLCSIWGGEKRIAVTFKFFIYTFVGSVLMLIGLIYLQSLTPNHSFQMQAFRNLEIPESKQVWLFWLFFLAFAIKVPVFPFHTWQPDTYEQSPTTVTMLLSGVMVKMGLFGLLRWLLPLFPLAVKQFNTAIIVVIVVGMVYASLVAIYQDNIKKLIAYSSIAHIGLMAAGAFTLKAVALNGAVLQMFSHGINIMALWIVADLIEKQTGVTKIADLGGIAKKAPKLTVFLVIAAFANIALPLTNAFVGEFMIFNGLYQFKPWIAAFAGLSIIFSAVYTLNMIKHVFYGEVVTSVAGFVDINKTQAMVLTVITGLILFVGIYPDPFFKMMYETVGLIVNRYVTI